MRLFVNTQPRKHVWGAYENDVRPVLDNIAAAAHACNIHRTSWVTDCFASAEDAQRFLLCLGQFRGHLNSYWFYALLSILEVDEQSVCTTELLARQLMRQAIKSRQIPDREGLAYEVSNLALRADARDSSHDFYSVECDCRPTENLNPPDGESPTTQRRYLKKPTFSDVQIVDILKEVDSGAEVAETCRKHGVSEPTYYEWKSQFSGTTVSHLAQLRQLQDENAKLKRMYADLALMHLALKDDVDRKL